MYRSPSTQPSGIAFPYYSKRKDDDIQLVKLFEFDFDAAISIISLIQEKDKTSDFIINKEYLQNEMLKYPKTKWFCIKFFKFERNQLKDLWHEQMNQENRNIHFFDCFNFIQKKNQP